MGVILDKGSVLEIKALSKKLEGRKGTGEEGFEAIKDEFLELTCSLEKDLRDKVALIFFEINNR